MQVGFIGLGAMGQGMARNLLSALDGLRVYNRTRERTDALVAAGAFRATSPAAAAGGGVVITMLADDEAVEACTFGSDGILAGLPEGGIHVSMGTIGVPLTERLTAAHAEVGTHFVAAPVFGRPEAAATAELFIMAAGPDGPLEDVQPLLDRMARKTFIIGVQPRQAALVKLAGNFLVSCVIEGLAEAMALVAKEGVNQSQFVQVLTDTLFGAPVFKTYGKMLIEARFKPAGFSMPLGLKDNRLLLEAAERAGVPMPFAAIVHDRMIAAIARGFGDEDWSAIARITAEEAGLEGQRSTPRDLA